MPVLGLYTLTVNFWSKNVALWGHGAFSISRQKSKPGLVGGTENPRFIRVCVGNPPKIYYCYTRVYDFHFLCVQAEFGDLNLASYSDSGTMVDIQVYREGTVVVR